MGICSGMNIQLNQVEKYMCPEMVCDDFLYDNEGP